MKKKLALLAGLLLLAGAALGWKAYGPVRAYTEKVARIEIADVDFASVGDGTYVGSEDTGLVAADVRVTVEGGVVTAIDLLRHENGRGEKAESVVDSVLAAQSLQVDAVSGATGSSKVILKAIERALKKAP